MKVIPTPLNDCYEIEVTMYGDQRGFFMEAFNKERLKEAINFDLDVSQVNFAGSSKGVLRGLHYQADPFAQTKLVGVTRGSVLDVVVDLRKDSSTFMQSHQVELDHVGKLFLVPKGFAHGYYTRTDDTLFYYFVDAPYSKDHEHGIIYNDTDLNIDWKLDGEPIVSDKDLRQPKLMEQKVLF